MRVETNPRCPKHPTHDVYIETSVLGVWHCLACHRPLGQAKVNDETMLGHQWPRGRRPTVRLQRLRRVDGGWMLRKLGRPAADALLDEVADALGFR